MLTSKKTIEDLQEQIKKQQELIDDLKYQIKQNESDVQNCAFVFDFDAPNVDAFSVERITQCGVTKTVIGYVFSSEDNKREIREWCFYCSDARHAEIAEAFKKYISQ